MRSKETYAVAVRREFAALHYLIGGDWGAENELHEHHYLVEIRLEGTQLDRHGYLIDIDVVTAALEGQVDRYRGQTLNSLPEFAGLNPRPRPSILAYRSSPSESGKTNSPGPNIEKSSDAGWTGNHRRFENPDQVPWPSTISASMNPIANCRKPMTGRPHYKKFSPNSLKNPPNVGAKILLLGDCY